VAHWNFLYVSRHRIGAFALRKIDMARGGAEDAENKARVAERILRVLRASA
jgi:hypothetical protein